MKKMSVVLLSCAWYAFSSAAIAASGEYWEITAKMEMPGMPFAMPAQTSKVCIPKGGEGDPERTQGKDRKCTFKDVQHSGNTVKFKGTCDNGRGDTMNMIGETTHDSNSFKTKMQMSSGNRGQSMNMSSNGKRVGGSCDTEEIVRKAEAQAEESKQQVAAIEARQKDALGQMCDNPREADLRKAAYYAGPKPVCSNKKEYCQAIRDKAGREVSTFNDLSTQEKMRQRYAAQGVKKTEETSIIKICGLDMPSLGKSVCKNSLHKGPQDFMDENCSPAQAKEYREFARKQQDCEGRGYTSSKKIKACMDGTLTEADKANETCEGRGFTSQEQLEACRNLEKCGSDVCGSSDNVAHRESDKTHESAKSQADTVLDGAKKLKGLFGF